MSIQRKLEIGTLNAARRSRDNMSAVLKGLRGYKFTESAFQWIWEKYKVIWDKGELATLSSIEGLVRVEPVDAHDMLLEVVIEVWGAEASATVNTDCETLRNYHRHDNLSRGLDRATKAMIRGNLDEAGVIIRSIEARPLTGSELQVRPIIDFEEWDAPEDATRGIPTGIRTYDEVTMGGAQRADLGVIFGVTNMGKSILATNMGWNAAKHKFRTLHIDTENGSVETRGRYIARATRKPTRALTRRRFGYSKDLREWAEAQKERIHKHLRLLSIGVEQTSMEEAKSKILELIDDEGWKPDLIIMDSADHTVTKAEEAQNMGYLAKRRYETMKGWAQEFDAAIWAVTQSKPEAEGKIATNKNVAWGYDKARIADAVLTVNPGLDDKGAPMSEKVMGNKRSLFVGKARKSAGRFILPMTTDFTTAYMAEQLEGEAPADGDDE